MTEGGKRFLIAAGTQHYADLGDEWTLDSVPGDLGTVTDLLTLDGDYNAALTKHQIDPISQQFLDELKIWLSSADRTKDDVVVLYFSAHGDILGDSFYIITSDTTEGNYARTAIDAARLVDLLREDCPVRRLLIIVDACYSGQAAQVIADVVIRNAKLLDFRSPGEGVYVIAASRPRQEAQESVFTPILARTIRYLRENTSPVQSHIGIDTILKFASDQILDVQQPYFTAVGSGSTTFFPNPRYRRDIVIDVDLEARAQLEETPQDVLPSEASGLEAVGQAGASSFTGRRAALRSLGEHLRAFSEPSLMVLTGSPGSGKSSVLGRLVLLASGQLPTSTQAGYGVQPVRIDASLVARGKSAADLHSELGAQVDFEHVADSQGGWPLVVLDALDEAVDPLDVVHNFIRPLCARESGARLIVATRKQYLKNLPTGRHIVDLDAADYLDQSDVAAFVFKLLKNDSQPRAASPYRQHPEEARAVADAVARLSNGSFLMAGMVGRSLVREGIVHSIEEVEQREHWLSLATAFEFELLRFGTARDVITDMLRPLAWAEGAGLPRDLWPALSNALREGGSYSDADVHFTLERAGSYIVEGLESGRAVYRLFHREFASFLRSNSDVAEMQGSIARALAHQVPPTSEGQRNWAAAPPYLLAHLATHAARGGVLDEILADVGFLAYADPASLLRELPSATTEEGRRTASVYQACMRQLVELEPDGRASQLELTATQFGHSQLREGICESFVNRSWRTLWARSKPVTDHLTLGRHADQARACVIARFEGRPIIVSGGWDNKVRLWDGSIGGALGSPLVGHEAWVEALAVADCKGRPVIVSGDSDGDVRRWDLATGESRGSALSHGSSISSLAIGAVQDEEVIVCGCKDGSIYRWYVSTGESLGPPLRAGQGGVSAIWTGMVSGRPCIVGGGGDGSMARWDLVTGELLGICPVHDGEVTAIVAAVIAGRRCLVSGGWDQVVRTSSPDTCLQVAAPLLVGRGQIVDLAVCEVAGQPLVATSGPNDEVEVRSLVTGNLIGPPLRGHSWWVTSIDVGLIDGRVALVTASNDSSVRKWDLAQVLSRAGQALDGPYPKIDCLTITANEEIGWVVGGASDGRLVRWDLEDGTLTQLAELEGGRRFRTLFGGNLEGSLVLVVMDDRGRLISGDPASGVTFYDDIETGINGQSPLGVGYVGGRVIAVVGASDPPLRRWDLASGSLLGAKAKRFRRPRTKSQKVRRVLVNWPGDSVSSLTVASLREQPVVVTGGFDANIRRWNLATGKAIGQPLVGHTGSVYCLAVAEVNGRPWIVSGDSDSAIRRWDLESGHPIGDALIGHDQAVRAVAVGNIENRQVILSGGNDATTRMWDLVNGTPLDAPPQVQAMVLWLARGPREWLIGGPDTLAVLQTRHV